MNPQPYTIGTIIVFLIIAAFILATIVGIVKGIVTTIKQTRLIMSGVPLETIRENERKAKEEKKQSQRIKYESKIYKITHPIGYVNMLVDEKIENMLKKGQR